MSMKIVTAALCIALCSCGYTRTADPNLIETASDPHLVSPMYAASMDVVHRASLRACMAYFGHIDSDRIIDGTVIMHISDFCLWAGGETETTITLSHGPSDKILVVVESEAGSPSGVLAWGTRERVVISNFLSHLSVEMLTQ
jgi:hypothetical protein